LSSWTLAEKVREDTWSANKMYSIKCLRHFLLCRRPDPSYHRVMKKQYPPQPLHLISPKELMWVVPPKSNLSRFIEEARRLLLREPTILERIDHDLDSHAKAKKRLRLADRRWRHQQHACLPGHDYEPLPDQVDLTLQQGRPRMTAEVCYFFLMLRGYTGGVKDGETQDLFFESTSIQLVLAEAGIMMPRPSTIIDNTNAISQETRNFILDAQLRSILEEGLDDFQSQTADSTAVWANRAWPTDSGLILAFLERIWKRASKLPAFDLPTMEYPEFPEVSKELDKLEFQIAMSPKKKLGARRRKLAYQQLIDQAEVTSQVFDEELARIRNVSDPESLAPSRRAMVARLLAGIGEDIAELGRIIEACVKRVIEEDKPSGTKRRLSIADMDAAYIAKGTHDPTIGYRAQVMRTQKGFVVGHLVLQGNANDASQFLGLCEESMTRPGVTPRMISADGGYASKAIRELILKMGVKRVSISSSKGKAIAPEAGWTSHPYEEARRNRSAVESLMYQLKYLVRFGRAARRGLAVVTAELTDKILAFNFRRICYPTS